jgi:hypothetical protein
LGADEGVVTRDRVDDGKLQISLEVLGYDSA